MTDFLDQILGEEGDPSMEAENRILAPLLEEIDLIDDPGIMAFVRAMLLNAPEHFWVDPSSFSGKYHPPDERGTGGAVLHAQRVVRIVWSMAEAQQRSAYERNILIAAALLHDITKGVKGIDGRVHYDPMHPYTIDRLVDWVRKEDTKRGEEVSSTLFIDDDTALEILRLIRCHMGVWSPIPETIPVTNLEWTLHFADMLASKLHYIVDGEEAPEWRWTPPGESDE